MSAWQVRQVGMRQQVAVVINSGNGNMRWQWQYEVSNSDRRWQKVAEGAGIDIQLSIKEALWTEQVDREQRLSLYRLANSDLRALAFQDSNR